MEPPPPTPVISIAITLTIHEAENLLRELRKTNHIALYAQLKKALQGP